MMSEIRILEGAGLGFSDATGPGDYETGLLHLPGGATRGVEDLVDLVIEDSAASPRRAGIAVGLRSALHAAGPLPRPFDLAASFVGLGLGALGGTLHATITLRARFSDGASARIATDPETAAAMMHDWTVVRLALMRREAGAPTQRRLTPPVAPLALPAPEPDAAPALTSIFQYEMRKGRLRRLASGKVPEQT